MENSFLRHLSRKILLENADDTEALTVVFPSRRACLFFEKAFVEECKAQKKGFLVPRAQSLEDWVCRFTPLRQADSLTLAVLLYQAYKDSGLALQEFDNFIPWAEILLEDFSEIDFQLADAGKIFSQGLEETKVDATFSEFLTDDEKQLIASFWRSFSKSKLSDKPGEFVKQWEAMPQIYARLLELLKEKSLGYRGLLAKEASINLEGYLPEIERHYFAGFAGFYKSHQNMVELLIRKGKAEMAWDADTYYVDGPLPDGKLHEAGHFFRKYRKDSPILAKSLAKLPSNIGNDPTTMRIREFEAPNRIAMAKVLATILNESAHDSGGANAPKNAQNTAIILADEGLLLPVIQSLPEEISRSVNVTSGIPLAKSQLFSLLVDCANLHAHFKKQERRDIETSRLEPILRHPYVSFSGGERVQHFIRYIANSQLISVHMQEVVRLPGLAGRIFYLLKEGLTFRQYFDKLLVFLIRVVKEMDDRWLMEELKTALSKWNRLTDQFDENPILAQADMWHAYRKSLYGAGMNFGGEPLEGLQIMGLLESRCLDFEHIIILGANEGLLPAGRKRPGFLPYHIRRVFGLFTKVEEESLSAYYLMRLFHRATTVSMVYAGSEEKTEMGEKSRYIKQLEFESPFDISLVRTTGGTRLLDQVPISIKKTGPVYARLMQSVNMDGEMALKPLHPSSLIRYLKCPLSFYLTNIAGLREPDDIAKDIDHRHFGLVLHEVMERVYKALGEAKGSALVEEEDRDWLNVNIDVAVNDAIKNTFNLADVKERSGEGILSLAVMSAREYARKLIDLDLEYAPFQIVQLEGKAARPWDIPIHLDGVDFEIPLHGTMDRVDLKSGIYRVVDFKTGTINTKVSSIDELFEREKPANTAAFQIILYSLILKKSLLNDVHVSGIKVEPALVSVKEITNASYAYPEQSRLKLKAGHNNYHDIDIDEAEEAFTSGLVSLLTDIFNPEIDFTQTQNRDTCASCSFNSLCHKDY